MVIITKNSIKMSTTKNVAFVTNLLKYTYGLVPIVAGLDKFANVLTDWPAYLGSGAEEMLPFAPATFMAIVGVIEIAAGILVLRFTKIGSLIVAAWLVLIAVVLIVNGFLDIAVRDLVMAIGAYSLHKLSADTVKAE